MTGGIADDQPARSTDDQDDQGDQEQAGCRVEFIHRERGRRSFLSHSRTFRCSGHEHVPEEGVYVVAAASSPSLRWGHLPPLSAPRPPRV